MATQELKFRVDSFASVERKLGELGAERVKHSESSHYYVPLPGNGVLKLVVKPGRAELHELSERQGKFELVKNVPMHTLRNGLKSLKKRGFDRVGLVHMAHTDYRLRDGIVGLYIINGHLKSVILDFPSGEHDQVRRILGMDGSELIEIPYNKYLQQRGQLELVPIDSVQYG
jgi:hypothetical protein